MSLILERMVARMCIVLAYREDLVIIFKTLHSLNNTNWLQIAMQINPGEKKGWLTSETEGKGSGTMNSQIPCQIWSSRLWLWELCNYSKLSGCESPWPTSDVLSPLPNAHSDSLPLSLFFFSIFLSPYTSSFSRWKRKKPPRNMGLVGKNWVCKCCFVR